jgi:hypothetical protein
MKSMTKEDEDEIDAISKSASSEALKQFPTSGLSLWQKLGLIMAGILLAGNAVISIYNSVALRQEVECNHKLTTVVFQIGDQSRSITRDGFVILLSKGNLTDAQKAKALDQFLTQYDANTKIRAAATGVTCQNGSTDPQPAPATTPTTIPSPSK